eukprot:TRINITY_DN2778_c0_g1_i2.p1 TRINITY_DN2778_c0_g1~~TRINITY_DN2778_c0_g1_i2.p1  ORF type:complete len:341 (-),score=56.95 TRINITY_DN2778_c0_g1_i2:111-1133(-)
MSRTLLLRAERGIYDLVGDFAKDIEFHDIFLDPETFIHMSRCGSESNPPLVLLHGYAACNAYFAKLLPILTQRYNVYCLDHPGTALSSRKSVDWNSSEECISYFVESLEKWRKKVGLERFFLGGHSFGGFISVCYARKYGQHVKALLLISPAGITKQTPITEQELRTRWKKAPFFWKIFGRIMNYVWTRNVTPFDIARKISCFAKPLLRIGFRTRFKKLPRNEADRLCDHFYASLRLERGSERAMFWVFERGARAKYPLEDIIREEVNKIPIVFYYGEFDWMNQEGAIRLVNSGEVMATLRHISKSSHQITVENPKELAEDMLSFMEALEFGNGFKQNRH